MRDGGAGGDGVDAATGGAAAIGGGGSGEGIDAVGGNDGALAPRPRACV